MLYIYAQNFADAMYEMVDAVLNDYEFETSPRGKKVREYLNTCIEIENPYENLFNNEIRGIPRKYLARELLLYFSGRNDIEGFSHASSFWNKIKNDDDTVNSAYGNLIFEKKNALWENKYISQWEWAKNSLINDKDSRQAVMHYNLPEHQNNHIKDFVCTMANQFFIRDNKLYLTTYMRSNDLLKGVCFDFSFFMLLMQCMRAQLLTFYPNLELGTYNHISASLHTYEEDFEILTNSLNYKFETDKLPKINEDLIFNTEVIKMSYDYNGEYKYEGNDEFLKWLDENRR